MHHDLFYKLKDITLRVSNSSYDVRPVIFQEQIDETILLLRKLNSDISNSINNDKEIGRKSLLLSVQELFSIYNHFNDAARRKGKTLESEGFDQHDEVYDNIKQIWYRIDEEIETLLHTLYLYFPDDALKNIHLYEKSTNRIRHPLYDKLKKKKEEPPKEKSGINFTDYLKLPDNTDMELFLSKLKRLYETRGPKHFAILLDLLNKTKIGTFSYGDTAKFMKTFYPLIGSEIKDKLNTYSITRYISTDLRKLPEYTTYEEELNTILKDCIINE